MLKRSKFGFLEVSPKPTNDELAQYYNDKYYGASEEYQASYSEIEIKHKLLDAIECQYFSKEKVGKFWILVAVKDLVLIFFMNVDGMFRVLTLRWMESKDFFQVLRNIL